MFAMLITVPLRRIDTARLTNQLPDPFHEIELPGGYNLDDYDTTQVRLPLVPADVGTAFSPWLQDGRPGHVVNEGETDVPGRPTVN